MAVSSSVNIRELVSFIWDYHYRNCLCLHFLLKRDYDYWGCERSLLAAIEPVSSVFFSVTIMHEIFYPMDFVGMIFIIVAVLTVSLRDLIAVRKQLH